ncbi:fumarylacetoacetate hydrolase family protein [Nonomuraea sp. CA-141351]|uniref:fumarylacetoacetate hydrolase family protein n=1 Tax=Nonomuraea sp. CA-141351 TaxID=3239996 RepID=UPI003D910917
MDLGWLECVLAENGTPVATGTGAAVLGSPLRAVAWLANKLGELGVSLEPGHVLLSGSFTQAVAARPGSVVSADFGGFGRLSMTFAEQEAEAV